MSDTNMLGPDDPGLKPPPGITPDFDGPYTLQPYQALTVAACVIFTTVMVAARMYTKATVIKALKWEDYTCVLGWAAFMVYLGIEFSIGTHGGGTHQWNVRYKNVQYGWQYTNYGDILYSIALFFTKYSILLLILRIFCSTDRDLFYWLTHFLIAVNCIFYTIFFFTPIFVCHPRQKIWNPDMAGKCLNIKALYLASAAFNIVSDIAMLAVPVWLIWTLQMSFRRKVGVSCIFLTGILACVASLLRLIFTVKLTKTEDYTYVKVQCILWAFAEIAGGLLCSCFAVLPRLYQHLASIVPVTGGLRSTTAHHLAEARQSEHAGKRDWVQLKESQARRAGENEGGSWEVPRGETVGWEGQDITGVKVGAAESRDEREIRHAVDGDVEKGR